MYAAAIASRIQFSNCLDKLSYRRRIYAETLHRLPWAAIVQAHQRCSISTNKDVGIDGKYLLHPNQPVFTRQHNQPHRVHRDDHSQTVKICMHSPSHLTPRAAPRAFSTNAAKLQSSFVKSRGGRISARSGQIGERATVHVKQSRGQLHHGQPNGHTNDGTN